MANIFGDFLDEEDEALKDPLIDDPGPQGSGLLTPAPPVESGFDDIREGADLERDRLDQAHLDGSLELSIQSNPQEQIRNEQLSTELEAPVERVEMDPAGAEAQLKINQTNKVLETAPKLKDFMKRLDVATKLTLPGDVENLSWWEAGWKDMGHKFDEGRLTHEQGLRLYNHESLNDKQKIENQKRIDEIDILMEGFHSDGDLFGPSGPFGEAALLVGQMVDGLDAILAKGLAGSVGGMSAAAMLGQAGPQALVPEEIFTVPAAAVTGFTVASMAEVFDQARKIEAGHARHEMEKSGFAKDVAKSTANIVGWVNGTLEVVGLGLFTKPIKSAIMKNIYRKARLGTVTKKQALGLAFATVFKSAGSEAGTEMLQEVNNFVQREIGRQINNSFDSGDVESQVDTLEKLKAAAKQVGTIGIKVLAGSAVLGAPGGVFRYRAEVNKVEQADLNEQMMLAMGENAQESELAQQLPDRYREIVEGTTEEGPVSDVFIDVNKIEEFYQEGASAVMEELGLGEQYSVALEKGGEVKIPLATYASKIARNPEAHKAFTPHSKFDIDGYTPTEAQEFMAEQEDLEADGPAILKKHIEAGKENTAFDNIQTDQRDQLVAAGQTEENATEGAKIMAHNQRAMAHAMGMPLSEYNKMFPLVIESVKNPLITTVEELEANGTVTDEAIEKLLESQGKDGIRIKGKDGDRNTSLQRIKKRLAKRQAQDLDQQALAVKRTPEFQSFFEGSQIVDQAGEPLVVYHGTQAEEDFGVFNTEADFDLGAHFGNTEQANDRLGTLADWRREEPLSKMKSAIGMDAKENRESRIVPVYLSIKNPLRMNDAGDFSDPSQVLQAIQEAAIPYEAYKAIKDVVDKGQNIKAVKNKMEELGYDGVVYQNQAEGPGDSYIAFHPEQIKSIFNERPTDSPDILNQQAGAIKRSPEFQAKFKDTKVVDESGEPLVVYRGEHGKSGGDVQTRLGSVSFGSVAAANSYATSPNRHGDVVENPRVTPAYLDIKNPVINEKEDPFIEMGRIIEILGPEEAKQIALKFEDFIRNTNNWEENFSEFISVQDLLDNAPERINELYFDAYALFDDADEVAKFKDKGFDGAIHGGNGETALEAEYKVFDQSQIKSIFNERPTDSPDILNQAALPSVEEIFGLDAELNQGPAKKKGKKDKPPSRTQQTGSLETIYPEINKGLKEAIGRMDKAEAKMFKKNMKEHAGTPWAAAAVRGMAIREFFFRALEGREDMHDLFKSGLWGKENMYKYKMVKSFLGGAKTAEQFARAYTFIGDNRKAELDISGSFKNCNPSKECAKHCYAADANARPTELLKSEFTEWVAETHPDILADKIHRQYNTTAQSKDGLALRINDKGDLSPAQLLLIKELNRQGIRMQIFSKRPDLLKDVSDFNLKMLSIDASNYDVALENPDMQLAVTITKDMTPEQIVEINDRVAVYLPVNLSGGEITRADVKERFPKTFNEMTKKLCPVDGGKMKTKKGTSYVNVVDGTAEKGLWTCGACDKLGAAGCFYGKNQSENVRKIIAQVKQVNGPQEQSRKEVDGAIARIEKELKALKKKGELNEDEYTGIIRTLYQGQRNIREEPVNTGEGQTDPGANGPVVGDSEGRGEAGQDVSGERELNQASVLEELGSEELNQEQVTPNWYYSRLADSFNKLPDNKTQPQSAKSWKQVIKKLGIKNQELEWTGIFEWLDTHPSAPQTSDIEAQLDEKRWLTRQGGTAEQQKNITREINRLEKLLASTQSERGKALAGKGPKITKSEISNYLFNNGVKVETVEIGSTPGLSQEEFDGHVAELENKMYESETQAALDIMVQDEMFRLSTKDKDGRDVLGEPIDVTRKRIENDGEVTREILRMLNDDDDMSHEISARAYEEVERTFGMVGDHDEIGADLTPYTFEGGTDESSLLLKIEQAHPAAKINRIVATKFIFHSSEIYGVNSGKLRKFFKPHMILNEEGATVLLPAKYNSWSDYVNDKDVNSLPGHKDAKGVFTPEEERAFDANVERIAAGDRFGHNVGFESHVFPEHGNIVAWIRKQTRIVNGKKILVIDEIQSDFEKAVRSKATSAQAPFTDSQSAYVGLAMKKIITYAVENGFDRVEWTTGSQQSERYRSQLIDNAEKIKYNPTTKQLSIVRPPEMSATSNWVDVGKIGQKNLPGMVGKDVARTLLEEPLTDGAHLIETGNVEISDKGMVDFYDRLVPDIAAKMVKSITGEKPVIEYEDPAPDSYDAGRQPGFDLASIRESFEGDRISLALFQEKKSEENRGAFQRGLDMTKDDNVILLLENADLSTYLHECAHFFYEQMRHLASLPNAPQQIKDDMRTLLESVSEDELISLDQWNAMSMGERRNGHEMVARGFEAYLFEGKAPSVEIESAFRRFSAWLKHIYTSLKQLNVKLTPEVRAVFDRMLATDLEIAKKREINRMRPLFENNDVIQMDPSKWEAYQKLASQDEGEADEKLRTRSLQNMKWIRLGTNRILMEKKRQIRPQREAMRDEVQAEIADKREYQLITWLRQPVKKKEEIKSHKADVTPEVDSLFLAIGKLGGISKLELKRSWGLDPATKFSKFKPAGRVKGGMGIDEMGILLEQYGYLPLGEDGKYDPHVLEEKFFEELSGRKQYSDKSEHFEAAESYEDAYIQYARDNEENVEGLANREHAKISMQSLIEEFGNEEDAIWKKLPKGRWGIVADSDQALDVNLVKDLAGYGSVDEMIHAITKAAPMKEVVEQETDRRMLETFGDLGDAASIERAVDEALHNESRTRAVHMELSALTDRVGKPSILKEAAKKWAEEKIGSMRIADIRPAEFAAQEARANRLSEKALKRGNLEEAADHKRAAVLNHHFAKVASKALEEVDRDLRFFKRLDSKSARKAVAIEYMAEIDRLLGKYDLRKSTSLKEGKRRRVLKDWVEAEQAKGNNPSVDPDLLGEIDFQHYKQVPLDELRGLYDTISNIDHLGRIENKLLLDQEKADLGDAVNEMTMSIIKHRPKKKMKQKDQVLGLNNPQDDWTKEKAGLKADHRKIGNIFRVFDGFDDGGPFFRFILKKMNARADWQAEQHEKATQRLGDIFNTYGWTEFSLRLGKKENRLYRKEFIPELPHKSGRMGINMSKSERLMVALNWGNETNRARVMDGFGINEEQVEGSILSTLDDRDWSFVEKIWDYYEEFWPLIEAKEKRVTGVAPEKVTHLPFTTLSGRRMRGGYHPITFDEDQSSVAYDNLAKTAADQTKMGAASRATTKRPHTKARLDGDVKMPVKLNFDVIFNHVTNVIHDLAWHEWLIDTNKIMGHQDMRDTIVAHHGMETYAAIKNTIIDIAGGDVQSTNASERRMNYFRQGVSIVYMGWNFGTSLLQPLGLTQSMVRVGPIYVLKAMAKVFSGAAAMDGSIADMYEKSTFMRLRSKTMNREINEIRNTIGRVSMGSKLKDPLDNTYFYMIGKAQLMADVPTWFGAYEKAHAENKSGELSAAEAEENAVARADQAVIDSQGSGHIKDLAAVQRGGPLKKLWTNFMSYFQTTYNLTADSYARTNFKSLTSVLRLGVDMLLLYTLPIVLEEYVRQALLKGECDDGKDWVCMREKILKDHLAYSIGGMLYIREFGGLVQGFADYDGPAGARVFQDIGQFANQALQGELDENLYKAANKAGGLIFHYPAAQMEKTVTGYLDLQAGKTDKITAPLFGYSKQ